MDVRKVAEANKDFNKAMELARKQGDSILQKKPAAVG